MSELALKSALDGSTLTFRLGRKSAEETAFEVSVTTPRFSGTAPASTYMNSSPARLFAAMAEEWRGWEGTKSWHDLEQRVSLIAEADTSGHIRLTVELAGDDYVSQLRVILGFEAGQLEAIAKAVRRLFGE